MTIIMQPLAAATPGPVTCADLNIISPNEAYTRLNCPVVMKTRTILVDKGANSVLEWQIRDRNGEAVDLTDCLGYVEVRLQDTMSGCDDPVSVEGTVIEATTGKIQFELPSDIRDRPSIYAMQVAVFNDDDDLLFADKGLVSVERGLFNNLNPTTMGPITVNEVRLQLRDTLAENQLLGQVEFDDTEIVHSIAQPIMYWNERPPPVAIFTPYTFPYRYHWLRGTVANLLRIAAAWYLRNKMQMAHGGMQEDILDRNSEYLALSQLYDQEWKAFVEDKKVEINIRLGYGSIP